MMMDEMVNTHNFETMKGNNDGELNNFCKVDLGFLGEEYQMQLVKCLIEDSSFFSEIYHVLDQNKFTNEHLRRIVSLMKDRYTKVEVSPGYTDLKLIIQSEISDEITRKTMVSMLKSMFDAQIASTDLIKDTCCKFFKQQNLIRALREVDDIVRNGNFNRYEEIVEKIQKAIEVNEKKELGEQLFDNVEADLCEEYRVAIPTGADKLDEALYGGLAKEQLGIIIAPMGTGKTSVLTGFAANAATTKSKENNYKGWKVLHIFFEDRKVDIRRKYYGYLTGIDAMYLSRPDVRPTVIDILNNEVEKREMLRDNIRYLRLSSLDYTASDIERIIKREIAVGFKPDLVLIDYFECLSAERTRSAARGDQWEKEGITIRKLEKLTNKYNIAMWVPVQGNRESIGLEKVGLAQGGGSIKKTQAAHVVLTLAQTDEQKVNGTMNLFLAKLRSGKIIRNQFYNVSFNHGTCQFDMSNIDTELDALGDDTDFAEQQSMASQGKDF